MRSTTTLPTPPPRGPRTVLVLALAAWLVTQAPADAQAPDHAADEAVSEAVRDDFGPPMREEDVGAGSLLFQTNRPGLFLPAPSLETRVTMSVAGMIVRARVEQRFHNPTAEWLEGVYVFPLPESAAVDTLRMVIGERVVEGEIREKDEARQVYETAKRAGRKASLVSQERPNVFTTSLANVGPDEEIEIVIEYQQDLRYDQGRFQLRFPMVVAPRYHPGSPAAGPAPARFSGTGWALDTDRAPDASRVSPPVAPPGTRAAGGGPLNPVHLTVELDPGLPLGRLGSPSHELEVLEDGGRYRLAFLGGVAPADRDFVLEWEPRPGAEPQAALFTQELDGETYHLLMVVPPHGAEAQAARVPRETVFVIDRSGSMNGTSIVQAKAALLLALDRLHPEDAFNVVRFNNTAEALFPTSRPAEESWLEQARKWVSDLSADGGTEMRTALELALDHPDAWTGVRQVIFITDGSVSNEDELLAYIREHLGDSRLFTVGIGSAPNSHFMARAAEKGRGTHTYVGRVQDVAEKMGELFRKLEAPVLHDIEIQWDSPSAETFPEKISDLYLGEPVVVAARLSAGAARVRVAGYRGDEPWEQAFDVDGGAARAGLDKLWARRKIAALPALAEAGVPEHEIRDLIAGVALRHHLVSKYTSLVAVDVTPTAPVGALPETRALPVALPAGWAAEGVAGAIVGALPQTATPAALKIFLGLFLMLVAWRLARMARRLA